MRSSLGLVAGVVCALAVGLKYRLGFDDSLDVVGVHLVGGLVGTLLIGFLATDGRHRGRRRRAALRRRVRPARQADRGGRRGARLSFVLAFVIGKVIDKTMGFRIDREDRGRPVSTWTCTPRRRTSCTVAGVRSGAAGGARRCAKTEEVSSMKLITAVIKPHKLDDVKAALEAFGVTG